MGVGQPLGVHNQTREAVHEQPWPRRSRIGGDNGQLLSASVGHQSQLPSECVVIEHDLSAHVVRDSGGGVRHVEDVRRGWVTRNNLEIHRNPS